MRRIVGAHSLMPKKSISLPSIFTHSALMLPHFTTLSKRGKTINETHSPSSSRSTKMPKPQLHSFCTLFFMCFLLGRIRNCEGVPVLDLNSSKSDELDTTVKRVCVGKIGECTEVAAEEELMDSESNRRALLMRRRYISYETLRRDLVPCDRPGASYYNCKGPGVANSYSRGCEMITRCARGD